MASAQSSQDMWRGRDRLPPTLGSPRPRHRSESRRLSDRRRPMKTVARKCDHCPGALHEGDAVHVFSRSADKWVDGEVVEFMNDDFVRVEYKVEGDWCGKTLHLHSDHVISTADSSDFEEVDPGANFASENEARSSLQHILIRFHPSTTWDKVEHSAGRLKFYQNNSFYMQHPLGGPCEISYNGPNEDILIKVYTLDAEQHTFNDWGEYSFTGYIHAKMRLDNVVVQPGGSYFLGIALQKDLNEDEPQKLRPQVLESKLGRLGGWERRGETQAMNNARDADYLLSRATANKDKNDRLLIQLTTSNVRGPHGNRPITFCTDRSLGFGQHFMRTAEHDLYLGKHGFGQPPEIDAWLELYLFEAKETKYGVLVLNPTREYFGSDACQRECMGIDKSRMWIFKQGGERDDRYQSGVRPPRIEPAVQSMPPLFEVNKDLIHHYRNDAPAVLQAELLQKGELSLDEGLVLKLRASESGRQALRECDDRESIEKIMERWLSIKIRGNLQSNYVQKNACARNAVEALAACGNPHAITVWNSARHRDLMKKLNPYWPDRNNAWPHREKLPDSLEERMQVRPEILEERMQRGLSGIRLADNARNSY